QRRLPQVVVAFPPGSIRPDQGDNRSEQEDDPSRRFGLGETLERPYDTLDRRDRTDRDRRQAHLIRGCWSANGNCFVGCLEGTRNLTLETFAERPKMMIDSSFRVAAAAAP